MASRDATSEQLNEFKKGHAVPEKLTTATGALIGDKKCSQTAGPRGPIVLQDFIYMDEMAHFGRERIPERVVHAKGGGAHGYLEITHDITKYCKASVFGTIGKKTPCFVRFSTVGGESGSADTARDPRGFAMKFYTDEGNWDLVGNNTPIFFIRDPIFFPSFIHTQKRNPKTHMKDPDMFWDFPSLRPEACHQFSFLFADRGTPDGFRHMNGYGSHTFKLVNAAKEAVYCKFHFKTDQGIKNLSADKAAELAGSDPDYAIRDLYNAIHADNFPSWSMYIQVMTFKEAEDFKCNPFDVTKVWPQGDYPLIPVGRMVLNRNPESYFAEVEQAAFCPAHTVPGIEPSPDKMLQGRIFSYSDTQRYRLGTNYHQIPINSPLNSPVHNYQRDAPDCVDGNQAGAPNYYPNSFNGPVDDPKHIEHRLKLSGDCNRYDDADDDNYSQVGDFWSKVLGVEERKRLVANIGGHLKNAQEFIQKRVVANFTKCHADYGTMLQAELDKYKKSQQFFTSPQRRMPTSLNNK